MLEVESSSAEVLFADIHCFRGSGIKINHEKYRRDMFEDMVLFWVRQKVMRNADVLAALNTGLQGENNFPRLQHVCGMGPHWPGFNLLEWSMACGRFWGSGPMLNVAKIRKWLKQSLLRD